MTALPTTVARHPVRVSAGGTVLVDSGGGGLVVVRPSIRDRLLARVHAARLDARLARGEAPESARALAVRALLITQPGQRRALARAWLDVLTRARRPWTPFAPQVPLARGPVLAAGDGVHRLAAILLGDRPVSATGVAAARALLTVASSPVYEMHRGRGSDGLATALERVVASL